MECKFEKLGGKTKAGRGINRNIVECKWNLKELLRLDGNRINRNIVECKLSGIETKFMKEKELIETLWNVNLIEG